MPRVKGQTDDIHVRIRRGLRDDTIDHMAIDDPRCWPWKGALNCQGHPVLKNSQPPHRRLFELHIRTIPGEEDYNLPTAEFEGTLYHQIYPTSMTGKRLYTTPQVRSHLKLPCTNQACINPYHRDWRGVKAPKPYDWNPKKDNPKELQQDVPCLPTAAPAAESLFELVASWFEPDELDQPFDVLFKDLEENWPEHSVDDLHNALIEVLKR